jgi:hypothetical protein
MEGMSIELRTEQLRPVKGFAGVRIAPLRQECDDVVAAAARASTILTEGIGG